MHTQRFLDSSLIDVDVHPTYVSIVIKSKLLRLKLPAEVQVSTSRCQRSKTSGHLSVIMPKVNPREAAVTVKLDPKQLRAQANQSRLGSTANETQSRVKRTTQSKAPSIHDLMMQEAASAGACVSNSEGGLLDAQIGVAAGKSGVDVANIVVRKSQDSNNAIAPPTPPAIVKSTTLITELDMTALD